jgi:hypothetical protein
MSVNMKRMRVAVSMGGTVLARGKIVYNRTPGSGYISPAIIEDAKAAAAAGEGCKLSIRYHHGNEN